MAVELYTPGSATHVKLYEVDGDLPLLNGTVLDDWLVGAGFKHTQPANSRPVLKEDGRALAGDFGDDWAFPGWQRRGLAIAAAALVDSPTNMRLALAGVGMAGCWRYNEWLDQLEVEDGGEWRQVSDDEDILRIREITGDKYGGSTSELRSEGKAGEGRTPTPRTGESRKSRSWRFSGRWSGTAATATRCLACSSARRSCWTSRR